MANYLSCLPRAETLMKVESKLLPEALLHHT